MMDTRSITLMYLAMAMTTSDKFHKEEDAKFSSHQGPADSNNVPLSIGDMVFRSASNKKIRKEIVFITSGGQIQLKGNPEFHNSRQFTL